MEDYMRTHLIEAMAGINAHLGLEEVVSDFPLDRINTHLEGIPYTAWELLEHMRIAQKDILDFIIDKDYSTPSWPDDYWPENTGNVKLWNESIQSFLSDRKTLADMVHRNDPKLFDPLPYAGDYTFFREITLVINHNSYHTGQLLMLKRLLLNANF